MTDKQTKIRDLYYDPEQGLTNIDDMYRKLKKDGITKAEIKEFLNKQNVYQLHKRPTRIRHYFPIHASHENQLMQIDLADFSDISGSNNGIKYILSGIDVFTRKGYMIPLRDKRTLTIINSLKELFKSAKPETIMSDRGSEFVSREYKNLMKNNNINIIYSKVKDYNREGVINRFIQTIRSRINKYLTAFSTTRYINVLQQIVSNYNNSYQSGIDGIPNKPDKIHILELLTERYVQALQEETKYSIGDTVRYILNSEKFQKGSLPKWSKAIHTINRKTAHSYTLDNGESYKYYDLQKVNESQTPKIIQTRQKSNEATLKDIRNQNTIKRRLNKEGIDLSNIIHEKRKRTTSSA